MRKPFDRLRTWHWLLAGGVGLAWLVDEPEALHVYLGYGVVALLALRLAAGLLRARGFALANLSPTVGGRFRRPLHQGVGKALLLGIVLSTALTAGTGLLMVDNGRYLGLDEGRVASRHQAREHAAPEWLEDVHEFFADLVLMLAATHGVYVLLMRREFALRMLRGEAAPARSAVQSLRG